MIILTIRTDKPEAELGLYEQGTPLAYLKWQAHRELAETIHLKLKELLDGQGISPQEMQAIIAYQGPGSFTGLRIGLSVANALAYSLMLPIVGATGDDWIQTGLKSLAEGQNGGQITPEYGAPPNITPPKH
jgi:tRNA threonylcarbamoyladenosine biosynthesis protein TsaB